MHSGCQDLVGAVSVTALGQTHRSAPNLSQLASPSGAQRERVAKATSHMPARVAVPSSKSQLSGPPHHHRGNKPYAISHRLSPAPDLLISSRKRVSAISCGLILLVRGSTGARHGGSRPDADELYTVCTRNPAKVVGCSLTERFGVSALGFGTGLRVYRQNLHGPDGSTLHATA